MPFGTLVKSVEDFTEAAVKLFERAQNEVVFIVPPSIQLLAGTEDNVKRLERFIEQGGIARGITCISPALVEDMRTRLRSGAELRHSDATHEVFMSVVDRRCSVSSINIGIEEFTLDTPVTAFLSESATYAEYLLTSFEAAWTKAVPAAQRIEELEQEAGQ